jgi:hypothetical protein
MAIAQELVKKGLKVAGLARRIDRIQVGPNIFVGALSSNSDIDGCVTVRDLLALFSTNDGNKTRHIGELGRKRSCPDCCRPIVLAFD